MPVLIASVIAIAFLALTPAGIVTAQDCPGGVCALPAAGAAVAPEIQRGGPVRRAGRLVFSRRPLRRTAGFFRERQPVRRALRCVLGGCR